MAQTNVTEEMTVSTETLISAELCRMFVVLRTSLSTQFYWILWGHSPGQTLQHLRKGIERIYNQKLTSQFLWEVLYFRSVEWNQRLLLLYFTRLLQAGPVDATKACQRHWTWNFRKLWPTKRALGTELGFLQEQLASWNSSNSLLWLFSCSSDRVLVGTPLLTSFFPPLALMTITTAMVPSAFACLNHCTDPFCLPLILESKNIPHHSCCLTALKHGVFHF